MMVQHDAHVFEWALAMAIEAFEREFGGIEDDTPVHVPGVLWINWEINL